MKTCIKGATIVNEGRAWQGPVVIDGDTLVSVGDPCVPPCEREIDATGCYLLPGVIDDHVHFRDPGLTDKADIDSESCAAAAGGVTTFFDMPNTVPQTTTLEALHDKYEQAARKSHVNYAFFFGATNDNTDLFHRLDPHRVPGIKLFMGSSTGNMLVDADDALDRIFREASLPLMTHCEDTALISANMAAATAVHGADPDVRLHPLIRSAEACYASTAKALELAARHRSRLHIAHVTTAAELDLIAGSALQGVTAEATVGHLLFSSDDYDCLGARIKVNPAVKDAADRDALRQGLSDGRISVVATDHAPHLLSQKQGGCVRAASGMPMVQFSLVAMLGLVDEGVLSLERLVQLMAHGPATVFDVRQRGFLRPGYKADLVIVRPGARWTLTPDRILSKCGWSPLEGRQFGWTVEQTFCNGRLIYNKGVVDRNYIGQPVLFR